MKIPKLFKKAAAFVMAAVTALSIMPATAFAAGDIGTIYLHHGVHSYILRIYDKGFHHRNGGFLKNGFAVS